MMISNKELFARIVCPIVVTKCQTVIKKGHWHFDLKSDGIYELPDNSTYVGEWRYARRLAMKGWIPRLRSSLKQEGITSPVVVETRGGRVFSISIDGIYIFTTTDCGGCGISRNMIPDNWIYVEK